MDRRTALGGLAALGGALIAGRTEAQAPSPYTDPTGVEIRKDVAFLEEGRSERLDLYLPVGRAPEVRSPAVVIIHGGGWAGGIKDASREINIGTNLARAGYVCASVDYRLAPPASWPVNLQDCKNGVRFLRSQADALQVDVDHIGVIGGSAGGHLALMVGYTGDDPDLAPPAPYPGVSDAVQAVVDMYGIANLFTWQKTDEQGNPNGALHRGSTTKMLGCTAEENEALWKLASPVHRIGPDTPPTLILQGMIDTTVDRDQSIELAAALEAAGIEHQLVLIEGIGHTFHLQTWGKVPLPEDLRPLVIGFFDKHLR